jgi:hypothetical protein
MRAGLVILLAAVALWRAALDWHSTIGAGYAFRLRSIGTVMSEHWPDGYASLVASLQASGVPFAWDPVGALVMAIPLALIPALLAALLWVTRDRTRRAR